MNTEAEDEKKKSIVGSFSIFFKCQIGCTYRFLNFRYFCKRKNDKRRIQRLTSKTANSVNSCSIVVSDRLHDNLIVTKRETISLSSSSSSLASQFLLPDLPYKHERGEGPGT